MSAGRSGRVRSSSPPGPGGGAARAPRGGGGGRAGARPRCRGARVRRGGGGVVQHLRGHAVGHPIPVLGHREH
ncbi:hypothetical protein, partial [Nocardia farcinica]|uniref:hypothetical protein n=1 Tax=Nocardia farcinica TaxID=37329 RepID=UPI0024554811